MVRIIGITAMNDIFELWSLPWHALQRSLANGFGAETAISAPVNPPGSGVRVAAAPVSWLARALSAAAQAPAANR